MAHTTHQPEATLGNGNTSRLDALINSSKEKLRKPIAAAAVLIGATALAACEPAEANTTSPSNSPTVEQTIDPTATSSPEASPTAEAYPNTVEQLEKYLDPDKFVILAKEGGYTEADASMLANQLNDVFLYSDQAFFNEDTYKWYLDGQLKDPNADMDMYSEMVAEATSNIRNPLLFDTSYAPVDGTVNLKDALKKSTASKVKLYIQGESRRDPQISSNPSLTSFSGGSSIESGSAKLKLEKNGDVTVSFVTNEDYNVEVFGGDYPGDGHSSTSNTITLRNVDGHMLIVSNIATTLEQ